MRKTILFLIPLACLAFASEKRALTFEDMFSMRRVSSGVISPDGTKALYRVSVANIDENKLCSRIVMVDLQTGETKPMTPAGTNAGSPVWSPDGSFFLFSSGGQIHKKGFDGSACVALTEHPDGAGGPCLSRDGKQLLFASTVSTGKEKEFEHSGMLIDRLMFKHWNRWVFGQRNHLFLTSTDTLSEGKDVTPGDFDAPPLDLGSSHDYDFSPDGKEIAFVKNTDPMVAISTNNDVFIKNLQSGEETRITLGKGSDAEPHYSPDGKYIAYVSMKRAGFEADRKVVVLYDRAKKEHLYLSSKGDHSASGLVWQPDSRGLYYTANFQGGKSIYHVDLKGKIVQLTKGTYDYGLSLSSDGEKLLFHRQQTTQPTELFVMVTSTGKISQLTHENAAILNAIEMNPWESFWFKSPNGDPVQGFMIKPPFFDESKTYPLVFLIHGGPQGMWSNNFHYRWNSQLFAAPGYVVVMINPHGSKGYGQAFCDAVSRDWGGLPYEDLMTGLDVALDKYKFIDKNRMGAAGASYGGYMIAWIAGHTDSFQALVCHNGVYNMASMAGATEELWFSEWEFGGDYYHHPELYEKWSPHHYAKNFKTPMLVVHSEKDYRVPVNQGMELFTAHQRQGVPSKWLYFPDEDHFVQKPLNAKMWWKTVHGWFATYLK
ncbi:MAG: dipeptidyl aminopeptidase [Acidobacteria bacterium]|nr:MAG: dipeptidyl aminopeptidase [Acidobacteriota bacterium]